MSFWRFLEAGAQPGLPIAGGYSLALVALSFAVASLAGYAGLEFAEWLRGQAGRDNRRRQLAWLVGGAVAMGSGVWAMHFIGMLAFRLPAAVRYDLTVTMLSGFPAVLAAAAALLILRRPVVSRIPLVCGGVAMAVGIGTMHYAGMEAMHVSGAIMAYDPVRFVVSIVVAAVLAIATLYVKFALGTRARLPRVAVRVGSAVIFGSAVCGMHYTAMTAVRFFILPGTAVVENAVAGSNGLALIIGAATTLIMVLAIAATAVGRRLERAASVVRELEDRTRLVLRAVGEGIVGIDRDGSITFVNLAGAEMLGHDPGDLIGLPMHATVHGRDDEDDQCALCATTDELRRGRDQTLLRGDGTSIPVAYTRTPLRTAGVVAGAVVVFSDITEQLESERALIAAKEAAQAAAFAKSEFLANMSHEIRTPMNGVIGMAQLLDGSGLTTEQQECVDALLLSGKAMMTVINDILDFSKIEAGKLTIAPHEFEPRRLIDDAVATLAAEADAKGLVLSVLVDDEMPEQLLGDSHRLRQVMLNLLGNAVKFTTEGEVAVEARCLAISTEHATIRVAVRDSGIGIDEATQERLFQAFTQADSSTTRRFGGTGLGLAISRQLLGLMGGEIGVDSTPDVGSTFWFTVPLPIVSAVRVDDSAAPVRTTAPRPASGASGLRVLVVEDNRINQMVAQRMLVRLGCEVGLAADGHEALEQIASSHFDLIFMDCYMPGMDGFEATRQQRARETDVHTPIIALTASVLPIDRQRCIDAGMDDYLAKPLEQLELAELLAKWRGELRTRAA